MIFSLNVFGAPFSQQSSHSAYHFSQAAIQKGHQVHRVFFYHDGVHSGSALATPPQDEVNITEQWQQLAKAHHIDLVICVAAGIRRGVINATEAKRYDKQGNNLAEGFELSGLGQLVDAGITADRMITFGA